MLVLPAALARQIVAHCLDQVPLEACGLLGGQEQEGTGTVDLVWPATNEAASARVYTVAPRDLLAADRAVEAAGGQLIGVWHSHTHTDAKPSATDIDAAGDPGWHYVLVSLRDSEPALRSWRIQDGKTEEEPVVLEW